MAPQPVLSKALFLTAWQCRTQAWYALREVPSAPNESDRFLMQQGQEVGELARKLYAGGTLVPPRGESITRELVEQGSIHTLFEASFRDGPLVAKADILRRDAGGWHVLEVKSSFAGDEEEKAGAHHLADLAYTVMVARGAMTPVVRASLVLLSREYRFGDRPEKLFVSIDVSEEIDEIAAEFAAESDSIVKALLGLERPEPKLSNACRKCTFFASQCLGAGIGQSVLDIPHLSNKKLSCLSNKGIIQLSSLPEDFELNERQRLAIERIIANQVIIDSHLRAELDVFEWPCYYLDFETVSTFLPLYPGDGCHKQVLTQFSLHRRDSSSASLYHVDYLAPDPTRNCEREIAEKLIDVLGDSGTILVYSGFEKTRIRALGQSFPDLAPRLQDIADRLKDLHTLVSKHVYHPGFGRKTSIKKVLPVLAPELSYKDLAIGDGTAAIMAFARMARGEITGDEAALTRQNLLAYCERDTLAMVHLHDALDKLAVRKRTAGSA